MVTGAAATSALLNDPGFFRRAQRPWANGVTRIAGIELEVFGAEHMAQDGCYVVMANHASWADIPVLFAALPVIPGFLAKRELLRVPFLATALRVGGHVVVDRGDRDNARRIIRSAAEQVRSDGKTVLIFPEGTRQSADEIGRFKTGGFHLAKAAKVPILPVGLRGTRAISPRESALFRAGKAEVHIGAPVSAAEVAELELYPLIEHVRASIGALSGLPVRKGRESRLRA